VSVASYSTNMQVYIGGEPITNRSKTISHFYASIKGGRGEATRCGTGASGINGDIRGWDVGIEVTGFVNEFAGDTDEFHVSLTSGSNGEGRDQWIGSFRRGDVVTKHTGIFLVIGVGFDDEPIVMQFLDDTDRDDVYDSAIEEQHTSQADMTPSRYNLWRQMKGLSHYICADVELPGQWYQIER